MTHNPESGTDPARLAGIATREELANRRPRPPNPEVESRAMRRLARELADGAQGTLERLAAEIGECCGADAAGVELLACGDAWDEQTYDWHAKTGAENDNAVAACGRSLGSVAAEHEDVLVFPGHELSEADPPILEALVAPFYIAGTPVGAVWAITRNRGRRFDAEDARVVEGLCHFAAASVRTSGQHSSGPVDGDGDEEHRLRQVLEALPAAVYMTDAEGRLTNFNSAATTFSGRTPELQSDRWCISWKLYYGDGRPMPHDECPMAVALRTGQCLHGVEAIAERPDGERVWFEAHPMPLYDAERNITGAINMLVDIRARKHAEAELRQSEADASAMAEHSDIGIHWLGPDGTILWANRRELEMLGYDDAEYIGRSVADFHVDASADLLARLNDGEEVHDLPARLRAKDGSTREVLIRSYGLWRDGRLRHTRCFVRDITDCKANDEAIGRLAAIVESSDDGILSVDLDGRVRTWNSGAERLTGYSAQEAIGHSIKLFIPADRLDEESQILRRISAGRRVRHYETVRQRKDRSLIDVSLSVFPLFDADGEVIGASSIVRDITERKWAEAALVESEERLRRLNRELEERVGERTDALEQQTEKLQALAAQLTTAEQRERKRLASLLHDELQQLVVAAQIQLNRCTGRVDDPVAANAVAKATSFLDETLAASRDLTRELRPPVLYEHGLVAALGQLATDIYYRYGLSVRVSGGVDTESPPLSDDLNALLFVCSRELLINSAKHAGAGSAAVQLDRDRGHVRVVVHDAGRGFDPDAVDEVAQAGVGGFGLFSIRERIAALGGTVRFASAPGEGTRVALEVPATAFVGLH